MNWGKSINRTSKLLKVSLSIISMIYSTIAYSFDLEINRSINARTGTLSQEILKSIGKVDAGTIVKVPDYIREEFQDNHGEKNTEKTFLKWLSKNGQLKTFAVSDDKARKDIFYPVEVVSGSKELHPGTIIYIPIRYLVSRGGITLQVEEKTEIIAKRAPQSIDWETKKIPLTDKLKTSLTKLEKKSERVVKGKNRLKHKCPITLKQMDKEIERVSIYKKIPKELLYAVMQVETNGNCFADRKEFDNSRSIGLYQVNTRSTDVLACSAGQIKTIKNATSVQRLLAGDLHCLHNPIVNLEVAADIMRKKYAYVNDRKQPSHHAWHNMGKEARDDWRKALAAYNGGQAYVLQAYYDIMDYNTKMNESLDPNDWETRRIFFFRSMLKRNQQKTFFSKKIKFKRHINSTYINMVYVEAIAGRETFPILEQRSMVAAWLHKLYFPGKSLYVTNNW